MRDTGATISEYARAHAYCARLVRQNAHSFYFAARFLSPNPRRHIFALYAFCRTVDDLVDKPETDKGRSSILTALDDWRAWLQRGAPAERHDPVRLVLAGTISECGLQLDLLIELVDSLYEDMAPRHLADFAELERYCHGVAGTVGIMMAQLLGARDPDAFVYAHDLGVAMQLTNVLRDVGEDLERGRIYLPADEMNAFGYMRHDLDRGTIDDRFVALMRLHVARARDYYERGLYGLRYLPRESRLPITVAAHTYAGILTKIERSGFDVFSRRAHTGRREKLLVAAQIYAYRRHNTSLYRAS